MSSVLSDVPADGLKELAGYLKRFPEHDEDADQYWYQLACTLRKRHKNKFSYSEQFLVTVGQAEDKAALNFLKDLSKRGVELTELVECLEIIKCQPALNFFQQGATPPELTGPQEAQLKRLKVGETLNLSVQAKCRGTLQYCWFHDQRPLVQANSPQLHIDNITSGHRGTYICKVTNSTINDATLSSVYSQPVQLEVYDDDKSNGIHTQETSGQHRSPPPVILTHPSDVQIGPGHNGPVTITCRAEQGVVYDWYKDGHQFRQSSTSGQLVLNPARDYVGSYHCEVVNNGGRKKSTPAKLSIAGSDIKLTCSPEEEQTCRIGDKVKLSCKGTSASGNSLQFQWFRMDGDRLVECVGNGEDFCTITSSRHLRSDAKLHYCCKVTTSTDPSNSIQSPPFAIKVEAVWIVDQPCDIKAQLKQRAQLTCTGKGEERLAYTWLKSSSESGQQKTFKRTQMGVLPFDKLSNEDAGYYQCIIRNKFGHVESRIVQVTPLQAHALESGEPIPTIKVLRQPRSCVVLDGKPFRLLFDVMCSSSPDQLSFQWYFNGSKINGANGSVYIREKTCLDDCGPYWCEVRTNAGSVCVSESARVELQYHEETRDDANWRKKEGERFFRTNKEERFAREKIALLIGNQSYQKDGLGKLNTPMNDILAVQDALIPLDFKVFSLVNLTHAEMQAALNMFYSLLEKIPGTYALFYFSGHGFSTGSHNNFLVPVDSPPDPGSCFQVESIANRMQGTLSRAILYLDACKVMRDVDSSNETSYPSFQNLSNVFVEWSCFNNARALDSLASSGRSEFNLAFINAISEKNKTKKSLSEVHGDILKGMRNCEQNPVYRMAMADDKLSLQDPIMVDDQNLVETMDTIQQEYTCAQSVPDPVVLKGHQMNELNVFAELKLSFSAELTNTLRVDANLHQLHDKTSSASVQFDVDFLSEQGVKSIQNGSPLNGQDESLCAKTFLVIQDLQKLKHPLKLLMRVCLWESGHEKCANISYKFEERPFIACISP